MRARLLFRHKQTDPDGNLEEYVVWSVPRDFDHAEGVRYRLAFVPKGSSTPAVLYDNHHPKGHHKHISSREFSYEFLGVQRLIEDFQKDIARWKANE